MLGDAKNGVYASGVIKRALYTGAGWAGTLESDTMLAESGRASNAVEDKQHSK